MITISCPDCKQPMDIDDNFANTEWECPNCEAAFLVQRDDDGNLQCVITEPGEDSGEPLLIRYVNPTTGTSTATTTTSTATLAGCVGEAARPNQPRALAVA